MPANQKTFTEINREKFDVLRQEFREHAWTPPYSDNGYLRGNGLFADLSYDEPSETVSIRVRELPKGETYFSFFSKIETLAKGIST